MKEAAKRATEQMVQRWTTLARSIARRPSFERREASRTGELTIIGSGIAHGDLTLNDEARIRAASRVFYCTNDRVTQTWVHSLCAEPLDLRILYDTDKVRYDTYVQMAEAMLHCTRNGERVVAIYYGHPGIFATPAHRAMKIAQKEGYRAVMRPGISALDYLVADIGFDPMMPGLQSFDASDLLLAGRRIDPTLHVVLWQVGMVGEFKFSATGFRNVEFDPFVNLLERTYGKDGEVVHYVASQYAGVEPLIERFAIGSLRDPEVRSRLSWLSTFYIAPATGRAPPASFDARQVAVDDQFEDASYGPRELEAIRRMSPFEPPRHYVTTPDSPAAKLMLELSRDIELEAAYRTDPVKFLSGPRRHGLTDRAIKLLSIPHPLAISAAFWESEADDADAVAIQGS